MYGAVELGGTKTICAVIEENGAIVRKERFPTSRSPSVTMNRVLGFFHDNPVESIGIASFGPICLDTDNKMYGTVLNSPKTDWKMYNVLEPLRQLGVRMAVDTDVNCSALGEFTFGNHSRKGTLIYITVGTGIGVGVCTGGRTLHGVLHPEGGHVNMTRIPGDGFKGVCPFHPDCCESLASGPAIEKRWGCPAEELPEDHPAWRIEAKYLAQLINVCICMLSPDTVVLGGGVMDHPGLIDMVNEETDGLCGDFFRSGDMDRRARVCGQSLNGDQALLGCLVLAKSI